MSSFNDSTLQQLLRESIRSAIRSGAESVPTLKGLGWADVVADDVAFGYETLFTELGRAGVVHNALDLVASTMIRRDVAAILPPPFEAISARVTATGDVEVHGLAMSDLSKAAEVVFAVELDRRPVLVVADRSSLRTAPLNAWHASGWLVTGEVREARVRSGVLDEPCSELFALVRRCLAHELLGLDERVLSLAVDHVRSRVQFGRPIGSFQSVRHRAAEMYVEVTAGRQLAHDAWTVSDAVTSNQLARVAKMYAGRAHRTVAAHAMQVCGAMGLTWEHPLPGLVRRGFYLESLLCHAEPVSPAVLPPEIMMVGTAPCGG